tara:strand:+ start:185 stop:637 length:453 start_codon:yes stop_codon:yes gene_type:complete
MDGYKKDLDSFIDETDKVIQDLEEFPYGKIAKIINTCSTQIKGLTTSGSDQMSHSEKRVRAGEYINTAKDALIDKNYVGLTHLGDSDSFDLMTRISRELSDTRMENDKITGKLVGYSRDLEKLENYIVKSQDLNINVDSDLGDTPTFEEE